jgi:hypothetical protein
LVVAVGHQKPVDLVQDDLDFDLDQDDSAGRDWEDQELVGPALEVPVQVYF